MKKIAFPLAAMPVLSVAFASTAFASGRSGHSSYSGRGSYGSYGRYSNYHVNYGTRFAHGYYYSGYGHNHWSYSRYDARYGCTCYYDPFCSAWYYWCEPASCYYPVTYCPYRTYCWTGGCHGGVRVPVGPVGPAVQIPGGPPAGQGPGAPLGPVRAAGPP